MSYCALVRLSCNVARPSFKSSTKKILNIEHLNKTVSFKLVSHAFSSCMKFLFTESVKCFQKWLKKVDSDPSSRRKSSVWCCRAQSCRLVDGWNRWNVFWSCSPRYWFPLRTIHTYENILSKSKLSSHGIYIPNRCKHFKILLPLFHGNNVNSNKTLQRSKKGLIRTAF